MSTKKKTNWWQFKNEDYFFYLLPSSFTFIGVIISILSFITILIINNSVLEFQRMPLINETLYSAILVGLSIISFSKEKDEDERIASLRFRSFGFAVGIAILIFVFQPFLITLFDLLFTNDDLLIHHYDSFYIFVAFLLIMQSLYFYIFKREL